jgi:hypothetical protein
MGNDPGSGVGPNFLYLASEDSTNGMDEGLRTRRRVICPVASWGADPENWRRDLEQLGITHVLWRSDRLPDLLELGMPMDRLVWVASNGPAVLYRLVR